MYPFNGMPNGVAEYVLFAMAIMFLVFLYFKEKYGPKNKELAWSPSDCALANAKSESIFKTIKEMAERRHELECQIVEQNKALMRIIEDNTRANTILAERLKQ